MTTYSVFCQQIFILSKVFRGFAGKYIYNGGKPFYQHDNHISFKLIILRFWNVPEFFGDIISFWRSAQLRQVVLSHGFVLLRLVAVLTNIPLSALIAMLWLTGELDGSIRLMGVLTKLSGIFFGVSLHALLVMNFDRYLATSYPLYHRTSMAKRKHLILFAMLNVVVVTVFLLSLRDFVITYKMGLFITFIVMWVPMMFFNYKLFAVAIKSRTSNGIRREMRKSSKL